MQEENCQQLPVDLLPSLHTFAVTLASAESTGTATPNGLPTFVTVDSQPTGRSMRVASMNIVGEALQALRFIAPYPQGISF